MKKLLIAPLFAIAMLSVADQAQVIGQAQEPKARKFDEFTIGMGSPEARFFGNDEEIEKELKPRFARYARQLRIEGALPYAITYSPRVVKWEIYNRSIAEMRGGALWRYLTPLGFDYRRIKVVDGGFREVAATELWIVPPGAQWPLPTLTVKPEEVAYCPFVRVTGLYYVPKPNFPIEFKAIIHVNDERIHPAFMWRVSQGEIVRGQGTNVIAVELPAGASGEVVAKVELSGYSLECPLESTTAISKTTVGVSHYKLDEFGNIPSGDTKARLDNLAIILNNDPNIQAHVVIYGGRFSSRHEVSSRAAALRSYLVETRGVDPERIITIDGGYRNELSGELWLSLKGTDAPIIRSTIDERYLRIRGRRNN